ncbi:MAG: hypothetical protein M1829_004000 [Trizodia sp. TS-e1964]|nr:MAG: hypothetical protein M1829_004000 [Trizodia sp. TS-e1964]
MPPRRRRPPRAGLLAELRPLKILTQIVLLQVLYYTSATLLLLFSTLVAGHPFTPSLVFGASAISSRSTTGWMLAFVWMLNAFVTDISLLLLVSRSKLVPDFALTIHALHLLVVVAYEGVPREWLWWGLQVASAGLMVALGVWSCQWREMQPINFGARSAVQSAVPDAGAEAEEGGGRGRGRGRDGAGEYEMVSMRDQDSTGSAGGGV